MLRPLALALTKGAEEERSVFSGGCIAWVG